MAAPACIGWDVTAELSFTLMATPGDTIVVGMFDYGLILIINM
jgi:hypothetical protein